MKSRSARASLANACALMAWAALGVSLVPGPPAAADWPPANGDIWALAVYHDDLIAGGGFTQIGGVPANHVARWSEGAWHPLGDGLADPLPIHIDGVDALAVHADRLIAAGGFTHSGSVPAANVAQWDGSVWSALGGSLFCVDSAPISGLMGVTALLSWGGQLIAGGDFCQSGTESIRSPARWDGVQWQSMGTGVPGRVSALAAYAGQPVAAGSFLDPLQQRSDMVSAWDGVFWSPVGAELDFAIYFEDGVWSLTVLDGDLIAGGQFSLRPANQPASVARYDGQAWSRLGAEPFFRVFDLLAFDNVLIAGGDFTSIGMLPARHVPRWDGATWSPVGTGLDQLVRVLGAWNGLLVASQGGSLMEWDGESWAQLGSRTVPTARQSVGALKASFRTRN
jgi:hypothetical protein